MLLTKKEAFDTFAAKHPLLVKKLIGWQRASGNTERVAEVLVEEYVYDLVIRPKQLPGSQNILLTDIKSWASKLSWKERSILTQFFNLEQPVRKYEELSNWYIGDYQVLAETTLDTFTFDGSLIGVKTINKYGAEILNSDEMLIVDVDLVPSDTDKCSVIQDKDLALKVLHYVAERDNLNFLVYLTAGGLRYIETTRPFDPTSKETKALLNQLYCDPLYVTLCSRQETFRARLTPKPWRSSLVEALNSDFNNYYYKVDGSDNYDEAVCDYVFSVGTGKVDKRFKQLIDLHDTSTKAVSSQRILNCEYKLT